MYPNLGTMSGDGDHQVEIPLDDGRNRYYNTIFEKYDKDRDGLINVCELRDLIESGEYEHDIPPHVVKHIHQLADADNNKKIDFKEFVEMINNPNFEYVFGRYINRFIQMTIPSRRRLPETVTDGIYEEEYSCYPPAVGMIIISLIEIIFFCVDEATEKSSTKTVSGPIANVFIYDPYQRKQVWRYITYMFVHVGPFHLVVNLLVQILLGVPLEMVHRWWRVLLVYFAGVLAGSLGTSITDPTVRLAGASGGVYSLITAHIATIFMNWREMTYPALQLLVYIVVIASDIGTAIYNRYVLDVGEHIGYVAHLTGAIAGLLVGLNVLRNLEVNQREKIIWWTSIIVYTSLMATAIIWNLAWPSYWPQKNVILVNDYQGFNNSANKFRYN
ncbi:hypothetical protein WA026_002655 [Henosepilachna vigintioctopunctata]|uniref:EF-hand domain-containing protein n=1 Tax=Henosepilachna vigintioctopunctata TaxID=420089 RepID=A0AAW1TS41_9CUCU